MSRQDQGGLAGLTGATTGLTFVLAPTAATVFYGLAAPLPIIAGAISMAAVTILVFAQALGADLPQPRHPPALDRPVPGHRL